MSPATRYGEPREQYREQFGRSRRRSGPEGEGVGREAVGHSTRSMGRTTGGRRPTAGPRGGVEADFESSLTGDMRLALHDFVEATTTCNWCADRCLDEGPEMAECVRLCTDVADIASLNVSLLSRNSPFAVDAAEAFAVAAEECAAECARHQHSHCQECAAVLDRAVDSTWRLVDAIEGR